MYNGKEFKARLAVSTGKNMTQIAHETGICAQTIALWSNRLPSCQSLVKLAEIYGISIDYLLFGENWKLHDLEKAKEEIMTLKIQYEKLTDALRREGLEI